MKIVIEQFIPECCWLPGTVDCTSLGGKNGEVIYGVMAKDLIHLLWEPGNYRSFVKIDNVRQISFLPKSKNSCHYLGVLDWSGMVHEVEIPHLCPIALPDWNIKILSFPSKICFINDEVLFGEDGASYNWSSNKTKLSKNEVVLEEGEVVRNYSTSLILTSHGRVLDYVSGEVLLDDHILMPGPIIGFSDFFLVSKMNNIYYIKNAKLIFLGCVGGTSCIVGILPIRENKYSVYCLDGMVIEIIISNGVMEIVKDYRYGDGDSIIIFTSIKPDIDSTLLLEIDRKRLLCKQSISRAFLNLFKNVENVPKNRCHKCPSTPLEDEPIIYNGLRYCSNGHIF